jgi:DNA-directed RNA polymerase specialized sigma24 family protein
MGCLADDDGLKFFDRNLINHLVWQRLANTTFANSEVKEYFDRPNDNHSDVLTAALNTLSPLDRQLLVDRVWAGHSISELAAANNLTEVAFRHRLSRARQTARKV